MKRIWSETELEYIKENYPSKSNDLIGLELNRSEESVKQKAKRLGISKNEVYSDALRASKGVNFCLHMVARKIEKAEAKVKFHDAFESIDTEASAYWLGFLAADVRVQPGNNSICLNLGAKDLPHLKLFSDFIGCSHPIKLKKEGTYALHFTSRKIHKTLTSLGVVSGRATTFALPNISSLVFHHFIRGFIDGDGWVSTKSSRVGFIASKCFCSEVNTRLIKLIDLAGIVKPVGSNLWQYNVYGRNRVHQIKDFLMRDATIFLERKWN